VEPEVITVKYQETQQLLGVANRTAP